jgi:hypothetical protein
MSFEIWETTSGNLAGSFETRTEALTTVCEAAERHGIRYLDRFQLLSFDHGQYSVIAEGGDLVALAVSRIDAVETQAPAGKNGPSTTAPSNGSRITFSYNPVGATQRVAAKKTDRPEKPAKPRGRDAVTGRFVKPETSTRKATDQR